MIVYQKFIKAPWLGPWQPEFADQKQRSYTTPLGHLLESRCLWSSVSSWPLNPSRFPLPWHKRSLNSLLSQCGSLVSHLLGLLAFRIKSLSLPQLLVTPLIGCPAVSSTSFHSVTSSPQGCRKWWGMCPLMYYH